jgi:death-on-curing protein
MTEWTWVGEAMVLAIHDEQLAEHGGSSGLRDAGLLQSALARPLNQAAYGSGDAFNLAAAYAFGIARNHPFVDGNKRTGFLTATVFLLENGYELDATNPDAAAAMLELANGSMSEEVFAAWLRDKSISAET